MLMRCWRTFRVDAVDYQSKKSPTAYRSTCLEKIDMTKYNDGHNSDGPCMSEIFSVHLKHTLKE